MTEEELAELRAYKPAEAAQMLNIPITRLETWVREDKVPHQRAGVSRGVEFSAEDIRWIGRKRPELMGGRRGGQATKDPEVLTDARKQPASGAAGQHSDGEPRSPSAPAGPPVVDIAGWAQLRAHCPRPRAR
jgi:hypothetical protein